MPERKDWSVALRPREAEKKVKLSITVSPEILAWIRERTGAGLPFGSVSHAFESGIVAMMDPKDKRAFSGRL